MRAGQLRQRVSVQRRIERSDGHDGLVEDWSTVRARIAAVVKPLAGRDLERARQVDPRISHEVSLRYWPSYRAELAGGRARLVYHPTSDGADDRVLDVVGPPIDVDEQHVEVRVLAKEGA